MSQQAPRVVYDCDVLLQSALSLSGPARRCLDLVDADTVQLLMSSRVLEELNDVLARPKFRSRRPQLTDSRIDGLLSLMTRKAVMLQSVPHVLNLRRDHKDEPYVDLAIAGDARFLVTRDQDLLALCDQKTVEGEVLYRLNPSLKIVDPVQLLAEVAG